MQHSQNIPVGAVMKDRSYTATRARVGQVEKGGPGSVDDVSSPGSVAWRDCPPLSGTDLVDFLALWRVCGRPDTGVYQVGEGFVEGERLVLPFLADGLAALIEIGHVALGSTGSESGARRPVVVTASGRARYEDLCDRQGIAPYPSVVVDGTSGQ